METVYKRRSIRKYKPGKIDRATLREIVKAGMNAPSARNQQPWAFVIIDDEELLKKIPEVHPYSTMIADAGAGILVCADMDKVKSEGFWIQDCAAATQNILLEIEDKGLGGVWLGCYPREDRANGLQKLLGLPDNLIAFALISLGHPDENKSKNDNFDEKMIGYNGWK